MLIVHSKQKSQLPQGISTTREEDETYLRQTVATIARPRHFVAEPLGNTSVRRWIAKEFTRLGYNVSLQGQYANILACRGCAPADCTVLIGAHYDSVPGSPGADDNASAVAAMLGAARLLRETEPLPILFVAFNREEDGFLGSKEMAAHLAQAGGKRLTCAHILEMVGYCSHESGSQKTPSGIPISLPDVGDFLGIVANRDSSPWVKLILDNGDRHVPDLPIKALKVFFGLERYVPHLLRSDHASFWNHDIPALMWTDTAEFRNPHYHRATDTPQTLDYSFLERVARLLAQVATEQAGHGAIAGMA